MGGDNQEKGIKLKWMSKRGGTGFPRSWLVHSPVSTDMPPEQPKKASERYRSSRGNEGGVSKQLSDPTTTTAATAAGPYHLGLHSSSQSDPKENQHSRINHLIRPIQKQQLTDKSSLITSRSPLAPSQSPAARSRVPPQPAGIFDTRSASQADSRPSSHSLKMPGILLSPLEGCSTMRTSPLGTARSCFPDAVTTPPHQPYPEKSTSPVRQLTSASTRANETIDGGTQIGSKVRDVFFDKPFLRSPPSTVAISSTAGFVPSRQEVSFPPNEPPVNGSFTSFRRSPLEEFQRRRTDRVAPQNQPHAMSVFDLANHSHKSVRPKPVKPGDRGTLRKSINNTGGGVTMPDALRCEGQNSYSPPNPHYFSGTQKDIVAIYHNETGRGRLPKIGAPPLSTKVFEELPSRNQTNFDTMSLRDIVLNYLPPLGRAPDIPLIVGRNKKEMRIPDDLELESCSGYLVSQPNRKGFTQRSTKKKPKVVLPFCIYC